MDEGRIERGWREDGEGMEGRRGREGGEGGNLNELIDDVHVVHYLHLLIIDGMFHSHCIINALLCNQL